MGERREAEESCLALEGLEGPAAADDEEAEEEVVAMGEDADVAGAFPFRAAGIVGMGSLYVSEDEVSAKALRGGGWRGKIEGWRRQGWVTIGRLTLL